MNKQNQTKKLIILSTFLFPRIDCLFTNRRMFTCLSCPSRDSLTLQAVTCEDFNQRIPNKTQRRQWLNAAFFFFSIFEKLGWIWEIQKKKTKKTFRWAVSLNDCWNKVSLTFFYCWTVFLFLTLLFRAVLSTFDFVDKDLHR